MLVSREKNFFFRSTPASDLYVLLAGIDDQAVGAFHVFLTPLVFWLWAGGLIMAPRNGDRDWSERSRARVIAAVCAPPRPFRKNDPETVP